MLRVASWQLILVAVVCAAGILLAIPNLFSRDTVAEWPSWLPSGQINLGLDLQGGSHLLLQVETAEVVTERLENLVGEVRLALRSDGIRYRGLGVRGESVQFQLVDPPDADRALVALEPVNPRTQGGMDLSMMGGDALTRPYTINAEGGRVTIAFSDDGFDQMISTTVAQSVEVVRRRIDELGTREPTIQRQGDDRILVQVPGEKNPEAIRRLLGQTARLTFHMVIQNVSPADVRAGNGPADAMVVPSAEITATEGAASDWVIRRRVELSGENLVDSQPSFQDNQPVVSFRFDTTGARKFAAITTENVGRPFAIVLDDAVISAPRINEPITGGSGIISGSFTVESANELALLLRAGALPAPLTVIEERTVGPDLGADSVAAGELAGIVAIVLVALFMGIYYGTFGIAAVVALALNLILIAAALSALGATLTLPGIAGIVLTIGMAVDANVLIFERIREEVKNGRGPLGAIDSGFSGALRTIIDANVTTLIAALLLFQFGSGPIKGFAVTLAIGIATSMFTAVVVTRLLLSLWYQHYRPKILPV